LAYNVTNTEERLQMTRERLNAYYKAELAIIEGAQEYSMGSRKLTRGDLAEVKRTIKELENLCSDLQAKVNGQGTRRAYRVTIRDL
jgi:hypothetical protein